MIGRLIAAVVVCGLPCACTTDRTGDTAPQRMVTRQIRIEAAACSAAVPEAGGHTGLES